MKDNKNKKEEKNQINSELDQQENINRSINKGKLRINLEENLIELDDTNNFNRIILNKNQLENHKENSSNLNGYENYSNPKSKNGKSSNEIIANKKLYIHNHQKENSNAIENMENSKGIKIKINFEQNKEDNNIDIIDEEYNIQKNSLNEEDELYDINFIGNSNVRK
jgi:hypothetical protein